MKSLLAAVGWTLLTLAAGAAARAAGEEKEAPDAPKEQSVVPYDSKTHGALRVTGIGKQAGDYFEVLRDGKPAYPGSPPLLNNTLELAPGTYVVDVNRTRRGVTIEAGRKTVLRTGELVVEGAPATAYWYPVRGKERKLASNPPLLNRGRALFPGTYTVFVHVDVTTGDKNLGTASVKPGRRTVLKH
ncbi:MAG TPA: hypothetical protein VIL46_07935 [Gemmataceae bacterium]